MMNQGENTETVASVETNQTTEQPLVQPSYFTPNCAVASWPTQAENHSVRENGAVSNSGYNHDQLPGTTLGNVQDGANLASTVSTSSSGSTNVAQGYGGYAAYPNTDPYGYNSTSYAAYYNQYQQQQPSQYEQQPNQYQQQQPTQYEQQPNQYHQPQPQPSQYEQQPNQYQQQQQQQQPQPGQYEQQPNQYQQQPNQYQQQPSQYQQQPNQYQQQPNQSYPHHIGAYQNTGAPYQPLSSFQNTGSYAGPTSYSSTYYNPGDYQTSGSYTSGTYGTQTNSWQGGQYASYSSHQYPNYIQDTNSAHSSTNAAATVQYQQQYKQWQDYYNQTQTEVSCAPGTENTSASVSSSVNSSAPSGNIGYVASSNLMPAAYTPSWRPESSSSELTSVQPVAVSESTPDGYWKHGTPAFQNDPPNYLQPHAQNPPEVVPAYENFQNQQNSSYSQVSTSLYPASYQVSQNHQTPFQTLPQPPEPVDSRKTSKLQIPTNPRIASSLSVSVSKPNNNSTTTTFVKPAYISVATQQQNEKVVSQEEADSMLKPAVFPKSLRGYVERALARCKNDRQKAACQAIMKEVITNATADGTLYTRDWDIEPLFPVPNIDVVDKDNIEFRVPTSATSKVKSPSRRVKSRWEPISEEKVADKPATMSFGTPKYGAWNNKQFSGGKLENRVGLATKFSFTDQKNFNRNTARPAKRQRLGEDLNAADGGETSSDSDKEQSLTKYYSAAVSLADTPEEKKKRENRSKRFDKGHGTRAEKFKSRAKDSGAGNMYVRRASALILSKTFEESGSKAVEDIDWDALTVKGTCQEIEKRYLRLTSAPDPATVRPEEVLEKALEMVKNSQKNYLYKCDQLKSIRQDLTVQHIRNELTVKVYETHARLAIEVGDLPEYNQCQSQLQTLYAEGISGCHMEFAAYNLLCVILHSNNNRDLVSAMSRLSSDAKKDLAVKHALSVRSAVTSGNYVMFFRLYKAAPNLNTCLMDLYVEKLRYAAVKCISRSYRPTVPVSYISQSLGFSSAMHTSEASDEKEVEGVEECMEWLKAHGACLVSESSGETSLDTKASASSLYMPEPEDAVSHGDANLAVNDFFTRSLA